MTQNDFAVELARRVEQAVVSTCVGVMSVDAEAIRAAPNFYMIREAILYTLRDWVEVLSVEEKESPLMISEMRPEDVRRYREYQLEKQAAMVVKELLRNEDLVERREYGDDYDLWRSNITQIAVLKAGKILKGGK